MKRKMDEEFGENHHRKKASLSPCDSQLHDLSRVIHAQVELLAAAYGSSAGDDRAAVKRAIHVVSVEGVVVSSIFPFLLFFSFLITNWFWLDVRITDHV